MQLCQHITLWHAHTEIKLEAKGQLDMQHKNAIKAKGGICSNYFPEQPSDIHLLYLCKVYAIHAWYYFSLAILFASKFCAIGR